MALLAHERQIRDWITTDELQLTNIHGKLARRCGGATERILERAEAETVLIVRIEGRIKRLYSIYLKMKRQKIALDQVYDLAAVRIITPTVRDCYAVLGVIHKYWHPVPGRIKDFIATPRDNLYQSLHTSVVGEEGQPFEVQIRTEEMHRVAEEDCRALEI